MLLRFSTKVVQVPCDDIVHAETDQAAGTDSCDFLTHDQREASVKAKTTVSFRRGGIEQTQFAGFFPDCTGNQMVLFPLLVVRHALVGKEAPRGFAELLVLVLKQGARNHEASP
ncbi:hypothetical protein D3C80_1816400 [compost metagenome]